ncbi:hypothetical protein GMSM_28000 [Geomonas sp. Red276]
MKNSHRYLVFSGIVVISVLVLFAFGFVVGNTYHQSQASGILTAEDCLQCHDGITGRLITLCLGDQCLYLQNHSILHPYPPVRRAAEYASRAEIEAAGCMLEDGKVTCLSCHNLTKPPPHLIRDGDELCYICHKTFKPRAP